LIQTEPYPHDEYLLSLPVPRWNSGIGLGVTALCGTFFGVLLSNASSVRKPTLTAVLFWCVIALTALAVQAFGRWLLHPPLALAATKDGLITFLDRARMNYSPPGLLIPWHSIQSVSYKSYVTGRRTRAHALVIQCADRKDMLLDVWSEKIARKTLDRVLELHQRFSGRPG
jgi:hypothetical protein